MAGMEYGGDSKSRNAFLSHQSGPLVGALDQGGPPLVGSLVDGPIILLTSSYAALPSCENTKIPTSCASEKSMLTRPPLLICETLPGLPWREALFLLLMWFGLNCKTIMGRRGFVQGHSRGMSLGNTLGRDLSTFHH